MNRRTHTGDRNDALLKRAVLELGIDVPIYRTESGPAGVITLHAYGGTRYEYDPGRPNGKTSQRENGETCLTVIPHVGPATAAALRAAGYRTFADLAGAPDQDLLAVDHVTNITLECIREHLRRHP